MYTKVLLSIAKFSSFINTKTKFAEIIRNLKHIGARFWQKFKDENTY